MARIPLRRFGYDIQRINPMRRQTLEQAFQHLRQVGIRPATVIDVGVDKGTPELYEAFPESRFLLVEPVAENEPYLKRILEQVAGEYVLAAASSNPGTIGLRVSSDPAKSGNATIFDTAQGVAAWEERQVPAIRLDEFARESGLHAPYLIKADTEGSELEVLAGAQAILGETQAVVLEVSLVDLFQGKGPRLAEVVSFMAERGFLTYDIVGGFHRPTDDALVMVDVVFVPGGQK